MNTRLKTTVRKLTLGTGLAVFTLTAAPWVVDVTTSGHTQFMSVAQAAEDGEDAQGPKGAGGHMGAPGGKGAGGGDQVFRGKGPGEEDSDAKGPMYKGGGTGQGGSAGKPAWAQEGLPTDDLGRLSLARAPQQVLDRQLAEALASFNLSPEEMAAFYNQSLAQIVDELNDRDTFLTAVRLDSPSQNLALLQELLADGQTQLPGVSASSVADITKLAAVFLATASDKTMAVTPEIAESVLIILDVKDSAANLGVSTDTLAEQAEDVREAIASGHGE